MSCGTICQLRKAQAEGADDMAALDRSVQDRGEDILGRASGDINPSPIDRNWREARELTRSSEMDQLRDYAQGRLSGLNWLQVQGNAPDKGAIFSFTLDGAAHAHDISTILDKKGVAVRAGQHCTGPLMEHLGLNATCRASFGLYNTEGEVDTLIDALELARDLFGDG